MKKMIVALAMVAMSVASASAQGTKPQLQLSKSGKEYLEKLVNEKFQNVKPLRIESGKIFISKNNDATLKNTASCPAQGGERGDIGKHVQFKKPFTEPPTVVISLTLIDHVSDGFEGTLPNNNLRIRAGVVQDSITVHGFKYDLNTWCNTAIWQAQASWIAYGR